MDDHGTFQGRGNERWERQVPILSRFICAPAASCRQKGAKTCRYNPRLIFQIPYRSIPPQILHANFFTFPRPHPHHHPHLHTSSLSLPEHSLVTFLPLSSHSRSLIYISFSEAQAGFVQVNRPSSSDRQHKHNYLLHFIRASSSPSR